MRARNPNPSPLIAMGCVWASTSVSFIGEFSVLTGVYSGLAENNSFFTVQLGASLSSQHGHESGITLLSRCAASCTRLTPCLGSLAQLVQIPMPPRRRVAIQRGPITLYRVAEVHRGFWEAWTGNG